MRVEGKSHWREQLALTFDPHAPLLAGLGSATPREHVYQLLALMDGLVGNQLVNPMTDFDPAAAVAALLRGLLSA